MFCYSCPHCSWGEREGHPQPCLTAPPPSAFLDPSAVLQPLGSWPRIFTGCRHSPHTLRVCVYSDLPHLQTAQSWNSLSPSTPAAALPRQRLPGHPSASSLRTHPSCVPRPELSCPTPWGQVPLCSHSAGRECGAGGGCPLRLGLWLPQGLLLWEAPALTLPWCPHPTVKPSLTALDVTGPVPAHARFKAGRAAALLTPQASPSP